MIETIKSGFYWLALALLVVSKLAVAILAETMKEHLLQIDGTEPGKWPRAILRRRRDRI